MRKELKIHDMTNWKDGHQPRAAHQGQKDHEAEVGRRKLNRHMILVEASMDSLRTGAIGKPSTQSLPP